MRRFRKDKSHKGSKSQSSKSSHHGEGHKKHGHHVDVIKIVGTPRLLTDEVDTVDPHKSEDESCSDDEHDNS